MGAKQTRIMVINEYFYVCMHNVPNPASPNNLTCMNGDGASPAGRENAFRHLEVLKEDFYGVFASI